MLTFYIVFLPLFIVSMMVPGIAAGREYRARLLRERARHDEQRFLRRGFLRERTRQGEQRTLPMNFFRKGTR